MSNRNFFKQLLDKFIVIFIILLFILNFITQKYDKKEIMIKKNKKDCQNCFVEKLRTHPRMTEKEAYQSCFIFEHLCKEVYESSFIKENIYHSFQDISNL